MPVFSKKENKATIISIDGKLDVSLSATLETEINDIINSDCNYIIVSLKGVVQAFLLALKNIFHIGTY